ncbi:cullin-5-like isoform X1 [Clavelina lepadiformis]|uniref:cullin-5-like isoform X1 n=1 Tax=Clavelina lepadiformis TaxID=159417 RepID=UPI0040429782
MSMLTGKEQTFKIKWPTMEPVIQKLLKQHPVSRQEWHDLHWDIHSVCLWDNEDGPQKVHNALKSDIVNFVKVAQERIKSHHEGHALLRAYVAEWQKFYDQCDYLPAPFAQLEKSMYDRNKKKKDETYGIVRKLMLDTWNESIFMDIYEILKDRTMVLIRQEREGEVLDAQLIIGVRQSFVSLCSNSSDPLEIYREYFESAYLSSTTDHYKTEAETYLAENGVREYMKYANQKILEEIKRAERYLETFSMPALTQYCVEVLVSQFSDSILAECQDMIRKNESKQLNLMFNLMDRVPDGVAPILQCLQDHIIKQGLQDMNDCRNVVTTDSEKYVELLLTLFNKFSLLIQQSFEDDPRFLTARDKAFEKVVNDHTVFSLELHTKAKHNPTKLPPESRCPELLANFCDMLLRKTPLSKKLSSEEIDSKLKDVLLVLKYVSNKDVFMRYHKAHLTRRLILGTSADSEKEENIVEGLREVGMPADLVNKLARMFQDIKVSEDLNQKFKESRNDKVADLANIKILNAGAWSRKSERIPVSLPTLLEDLIPDVEEFYKSQHTGRKLHWNHLMSNAVLTFKTECGQYDLEVTTFQMSVLFVWNMRPKEAVSYESLRLATQLSDAELRKTLWSLVSNAKMKRQVLVSEPKVSNPKEFTDSSMISVNQQFCLLKGGKPQKRGRVNLIGRLQLSTDKSREEDNEGITQLRILRTQEAIVKILKMRKKISNAQLQTELVEILKNMFLPQKKLIKQQIEWLIDHKYMKRDENDINTFIYIT